MEIALQIKWSFENPVLEIKWCNIHHFCFPRGCPHALYWCSSEMSITSGPPALTFISEFMLCSAAGKSYLLNQSPYHTLLMLTILNWFCVTLPGFPRPFSKHDFSLQTNLRMFMGATPSQVLVLGLNLSTEFRQLVPSLPPATYSIPSSTATPALLRRLSMLAMAVHALLCSVDHKANTRGGLHLTGYSSMCHFVLRVMINSTAQNLPGGHISPLLRGVRSCHNLPLHTSCHLESGKKSQHSECKY